MKEISEEMVEINKNIKIKIIRKSREFRELDFSHFRFSINIEIYKKDVLPKIGYMHIVSNNFREKEAVAFIIDFIIEEKYRDFGTGTLVLQKVLDWLKDKDIVLIFGAVDGVKDNKALAKKFYVKNGFTLIEDKIIKFL